MKEEDRFVIIKNLLRILKDPLVIVDIGARWGFQEHWKQLGEFAQLIGMDADEQEVQILNVANEGDDFIPKVLGSKNGIGQFYIAEDPACSSLYPPDSDLIRNRPTLKVTSLVSTKSVEISTLDDWTQAKGISNVDFIKLDVQGAELDILQGAIKTLRSVRMLEVEVQFNPLYQGVPLFGDVDRYLREQGFSLWRIKNFTHYGMAGVHTSTNPVETVNYDYHTVQYHGRDGQLYWADAFYVRNEIANQVSLPWRISLKDACIAKVLGFDDISANSLDDVLKNCPADITALVNEKSNPAFLDEKRRIKITTSCTDCNLIPKVPRAGQVIHSPTGSYQLMHNGVKVIENCYYGRWMTELIGILQGHHEPQEEKAFYEILKYIPAGSVMIEVGSFWSYYSLWFQKQIEDAKNYMIEPDPNNLEVGRKNFELNGMEGTFLNAAIGKMSKASIHFQCESDNLIRPVRVISIDDFVVQYNIDHVEVLLCDTQGFELEMLEGSINCIKDGLIRFLIISTHHHSISQDPLTHQKCRKFLTEHGAHILVEHTIAESFSGDGLIVASFSPKDTNLPKIEISRNSTMNNLFQEIEYDLSDALEKNEQLHAELNSLYKSRSYRVTKLLRDAGYLIRRLFKRL